MASDLIVGAFTLGGVALGFLAPVARDALSEHKAQKQARRETMSAARHVWYEVAEFKASTELAAADPDVQGDDLVIGPLRSREEWNRHGDMLATEQKVDFGTIHEAYAAARFAADALLEGTPAHEVRDQYRGQFERAMDALTPLAELPER